MFCEYITPLMICRAFIKRRRPAHAPLWNKYAPVIILLNISVFPRNFPTSQFLNFLSTTNINRAMIIWKLPFSEPLKTLPNLFAFPLWQYLCKKLSFIQHEKDKTESLNALIVMYLFWYIKYGHITNQTYAGYFHLHWNLEMSDFVIFSSPLANHNVF